MKAKIAEQAKCPICQRLSRYEYVHIDGKFIGVKDARTLFMMFLVKKREIFGWIFQQNTQELVQEPKYPAVQKD